MANRVSTTQLILVPAILTLAITLLRQVGELQHWSTALFNPAAGGGGALVGIAWLVPLFGAYFAWKLAEGGERPSGPGPAIGWPLLGFAIVPVAGFAAFKLGAQQGSSAMFGVIVVGSLVGAVLAFRGWPALSRVLLAYAFAARIPVVIVMLFAILGNWGTHYDVPPPNFPEVSPIAKWAMIGVLPQMTIWIWFTIAVGALLGGLTVAVTGRARR
jgi:hypothetical protein